VIKKEAEKILKYKRPHNRNSAHLECEGKCDRVIKGATGAISESLTQCLSHIPRKHEIKGNTKNSHIVHCTRTAGSADVTVQSIFQGEITLHVPRIVNREQLQHCVP
jgi:hypothetical protein